MSKKGNLNIRSNVQKLRPVFAVILGLMLGLAVTAIAGENPWTVLKILARSAFGSSYDFAMTLFYATPLIFTGLAVAIPFQAGLFNIGAEGQLEMGALFATCVAVLFPGLPWPLAPLAAGLAAFLGGAIWGGIPGWLRARRGSHEVINTIMLNFIAAGLASYVALYWIRSTDTQGAESQMIAEAYRLMRLPGAGDAPLNVSFLVSLGVAAALSVFFSRTVRGFEIRVTGENERAAWLSGTNPETNRILSMVLAGGIAGLVGINEVLGNAWRFKVGFSPGYGFVGIAVALLGRAKPWGVLGAALLFGALHKGTADLDLETENVTRDLSLILQALIILCVAADGLWDRLLGKKELST